MIIFSINIPFKSFFWNSMRAACCDCVLQVLQKVIKKPKKDLVHPKDHLKRSLRPLQATQLTPGPFWTRQKRKVAF